MKRSYHRLDWEQWLSFAAEYYSTYGNLLVERNYISVGGYRLGRWIERQRAMYNGVLSSTLGEERIAALEAVGMVWKLEYRNQWACWMEQVQIYKEEHGDLCVPKNYEVGIFRLGNWIAEQRKKYSKGLLTKAQVKDLENFGMSWSEGERRSWEDWYRDAVHYYDTFGNLLVPVAYETSEGKKLGSWIAIQREKYVRTNKRMPLSSEHIALLNQLDMVWNLQDVRENEWEIMYGLVNAFVQENGRLPLWPRNITAPDGRSLPYWISVQRTRLSENKCSGEQEKKLRQLGIYAWKSDGSLLESGG